MSNHAPALCYKTISRLTPKEQTSLEVLMKQCDDYEPYYMEETASILMFAAFSETEMIGFLSVLLDNDAANEKELWELTALVSPAFRRIGVFTKLFSMAESALLAHKDQGNFAIIGTKPAHIPDFPFACENAFAEYMFKLTATAYNDLRLSHDFDHSFDHFFEEKEAFADCEYAFTDDSQAYLMYENEAAQEPCATLNLAPEATFSNVYGVFVEPSLRGLGYGTALMLSFLEDYFEEFDTPLVLNVRDSNTAAFLLYKKCGFTEVSHISYYFYRI